MSIRRNVVCGALAGVWVCLAGVSAQDRSKKPPEKKNDIEATVQLKGALKNDPRFLQIAYPKVEKKGKRPKATKAFVGLPKKLVVYRDRRVRLEDIEPETKVWIFGRPIEREVRGGGGGGGAGLGGGGRGGTDRQIQTATVVIFGDGVAVNHSYKDRKDKTLKWCQATVTMVKGGLRVDYEGSSYRVGLASKAPVIRREKCDRKLAAKAKYGRLDARKTKTRPKEESKLNAKYESFIAKRLILLDSRLLRTAYPALFADR